ncbi:hypothetical protein K504DRAFT_486859 [Pleomassaria siparia CBS 279.74]|uniref:Uncharacterized protein n=1 Tax=Pleomassaria siparia CBS 279.74 TaxID=1314801 RepID=A0A6G1KQD8_9PLEO|nr:hypothetical protein K504DRAFT_486859 [Pleomassaria siparia CBS 279.74]
MACINQQNIAPSSFSDALSPSFIHSRRPALIPHNCSLSLAEAEELVRTRIHRPLFPPPDPQLLRNIRSMSPDKSIHSGSGSLGFTTGGSLARGESSPLNYGHSTEPTSMPLSAARHSRYRTNWVKARAHYARDRSLRSCSPGNLEDFQGSDTSSQKSGATDISPKRKHSAFVIEEELKCQDQDRVGTPHPCEGAFDEDVTSELPVGELGMEGGATAIDLGTSLTKINEVLERITSEPEKHC